MNPLQKLAALKNAPNKRVFARALRKSAVPRRGAVDLERNLRETYGWLCRAQEATNDAGVSAMYSLVLGWTASYPETTGYIIPTFLAYASAMDEPAARERALRMAHWEVDVQLPTGAVRSSWMDREPAPAVFNTGQVLFGWVGAYLETGDERFREAAGRAARWLIEVQDEDGAWRKHLSLVTNTTVQTYNVRAAWGLGLAGHVFEEPTWVEAARKNADWTLTQQDPNGWWRNCNFQQGTDPVLHTISYVQEGLLGLGELFEEERYIESAIRGTEPLIRRLRAGVSLRGRFDSSWQETSSWKCITGDAQVAIVLYRLARRSDRYKDLVPLADRILAELATYQDLDGPYDQSRGGVAGSHPIWGAYCGFSYINHAAKFYLDALLLGVRDTDPQPVPPAK